MAFDLEIIRLQIIALLNLSTRDTAGIPAYTSALGDSVYSAGEMTRACQSAATDIGRTIGETDGHGHRHLFTAPTALTHGVELPSHLGSIGVPRITPFSGATYTLMGKRKSIEEISSYRANPAFCYSDTNHNLSVGGSHSKLAGFYAIDTAVQTFYFTGFSAESDITSFIESSYTLLPDIYYPLAIALAISHLKKDGDASDVFSYYQNLGMQGLAAIRAKEIDQPSIRKTVGNRDSGQK